MGKILRVRSTFEIQSEAHFKVKFLKAPPPYQCSMVRMRFPSLQWTKLPWSTPNYTALHHTTGNNASYYNHYKDNYCYFFYSFYYCQYCYYHYCCYYYYYLLHSTELISAVSHDTILHYTTPWRPLRNYKTPLQCIPRNEMKEGIPMHPNLQTYSTLLYTTLNDTTPHIEKIWQVNE